ncbi:MAG: ImmA/IrrE family metallo-endopeptidase [Idiomarina sp.]|nr:ImmA/IrrE family metallo-endopeptidase [Idiomarina sp.]
MVEALVNPSILAWARERAGFAVSDIAEKLKIKQDQVLAWEAGEKKPTFKQAQRFADRTFIPFGYLFLSTPPHEELPIPDLRTVGDHPIGQFSLALKDTIRATIERRDWYQDYRLEQGLPPLTWVGDMTLDNFEGALAKVRELLSDRGEPRPPQFHQYYLQLIERMEALGILVMRNSVVGNNTHRPLDAQEFRGFAIADVSAPVIFVNAADVSQAQIFTLLHEFVHLLLGESGVSDLNHKNDNAVETFCNKVAAEFLVPGVEFSQLWQSEVDNWKVNLPELAAHFHVSHWVIARRALEHQLITEAEYWAHYGKILAAFKREKDNQRQKDGGPPFTRLINTRYSKNLAAAVASEALSGRMLLRDAQHLIGIQPSKLKAFAKAELKF